MAEQAKMYWIHALTPVHVGSGEGAGFIDLPVLREKHTRWPYIPGSSVKGVLADSYRASVEARKTDPLLKAAFGLADDEDSTTANAGSLVFSDARLVCLPVRSLYGTFAWATTALALRRLRRDLTEAGVGASLAEVDGPDKDDAILVPAGVSSLLVSAGKVYFNDLDFSAREDAEAASWSGELAKWLFPDEEVWRTDFQNRFAIVSDTVFNHLSETATEVCPRIRISAEKKIVEGGALWYEESLPAETVTAGLVWCDRIYASANGSLTPKALLDKYCSTAKRLQIGGKASVGRGRVRCLFS
jgi:CRISPR-associated protein Cmr4